MVYGVPHSKRCMSGPQMSAHLLVRVWNPGMRNYGCNIRTARLYVKTGSKSAMRNHIQYMIIYDYMYISYIYLL